MTHAEIAAFQEKILSWYKQHKRDLPWRKSRDPYSILVSEIMLQQTQVSRVIPKYEAWLERFPDIESLAKAPVSEVLRYWSGLGYNRRALNLQRAAQEIVEKYKGEFPKRLEDLKSLPGIGEYTSSAVASFAFGTQIPVIDTNVRKVIVTEFFAGVLPDEKSVIQVAKDILPQGLASDWNQALMDYSSLVLKSVKIPVKKQSHFRSSDRWYRGQVVKLLFATKSISFSGLLDYFSTTNPIDAERLEGILLKLSKDGLIRYEDRTILGRKEGGN